MKTLNYLWLQWFRRLVEPVVPKLSGRENLKILTLKVKSAPGEFAYFYHELSSTYPLQIFKTVEQVKAKPYKLNKWAHKELLERF